MVEFQNEDATLSRRLQTFAKHEEPPQDSSDSSAMEDKTDEDVFVKEKNDENRSTEATSNAGLLTRLSGGVLNTASSAVGTAYGGVSWVAGGVWSTTGTAIGATYNTVSALSPVNLFRKQSKSKSD